MKDFKIPEGYQTIMPYLIVDDAHLFIEFMKKTFGATEKAKYLHDDQSIMHAEIQIRESVVMLAQSSEQFPKQTAGMFIYVDNVDQIYQQALANGAVPMMEPANQDYGRAAGIIDPTGNTWWITEPVLETIT